VTSPTDRRLAVPAYFHPAVGAGDWAALAAHADRLRAVILNIDSGPGTAPEPELGAAARRVAAAGGRLLGYVDTAYGARPDADVCADVERYLAWYPIVGIFLDRVVTAGSALPRHRRLAAAVRAVAPGTLVANHGTWPAPGYAGCADALVTFEGPARAHARWETPPWGYAVPPGSLWHLVYDVPAAGLDAVLRHAAASNVATVFATDRYGANPWDGLPPYLTRAADAWSSTVATAVG
jgi:hypothetical protein